jgi:hypothetical protein
VFDVAALAAFAVVVAAHEHAAATRTAAVAGDRSARQAAALAAPGPGPALVRALVRLVGLAYAAPVGRHEPDAAGDAGDTR